MGRQSHTPALRDMSREWRVSAILCTSSLRDGGHRSILWTDLPSPRLRPLAVPCWRPPGGAPRGRGEARQCLGLRWKVRTIPSDGHLHPSSGAR
eukprot:scaffold2911_cov414-Prasinococcus_capsulatus_cf.AAC.51